MELLHARDTSNANSDHSERAVPDVASSHTASPTDESIPVAPTDLLGSTDQSALSVSFLRLRQTHIDIPELHHQVFVQYTSATYPQDIHARPERHQNRAKNNIQLSTSKMSYFELLRSHQSTGRTTLLPQTFWQLQWYCRWTPYRPPQPDRITDELNEDTVRAFQHNLL